MRWEDDGYEYTATSDAGASMPGLYEDAACVRQAGDSWTGNHLILRDDEHHLVEYTYKGEAFEAAALTRAAAEDLAREIAQWCTGDILRLERRRIGRRRGDTIFGHRPATDEPVTLDEVKAAFAETP